jgi:hypothetical protein
MKVATNFEKNYNTYCRTWGVAEEEEKPNHEERAVVEQEEEVEEDGNQQEEEPDHDDWDESVAMFVLRKQ